MRFFRQDAKSRKHWPPEAKSHPLPPWLPMSDRVLPDQAWRPGKLCRSLRPAPNGGQLVRPNHGTPEAAMHGLRSVWYASPLSGELVSHIGRAVSSERGIQSLNPAGLVGVSRKAGLQAVSKQAVGHAPPQRRKRLKASQQGGVQMPVLRMSAKMLLPSGENLRK